MPPPSKKKRKPPEIDEYGHMVDFTITNKQIRDTYIDYRKEKQKYVYPEAPKRDEALVEYEELQLENAMVHFKPKSKATIAKEMKTLLENGKLTPPEKFGTNSSVLATTINDRPLKWPYHHKQWLKYSYYALETADAIHEGKTKPHWQLVKYRSENDFKAGIYSQFVPIWTILINKLSDEKIKHIAYKLIHGGVSVFDNQAQISIRHKVPYRNKVNLCSQTTVHPKNLWTLNNINQDQKFGKSYVISDTKHTTKCHYPAAVKKDEGGNLVKHPFYEENSEKTSVF